MFEMQLEEEAYAGVEIVVDRLSREATLVAQGDELYSSIEETTLVGAEEVLQSSVWAHRLEMSSVDCHLDCVEVQEKRGKYLRR